MIRHFAAGAASIAMLTAAAVVPMPTIGTAHAATARGCTDGRDRRVRMVNATRYTIVRLYGSRSTTDNWEEDVLGDGVLRPGNSVTVNWDDGTCECMFDFKAVYSDDDTSVKEEVNVCRLQTFRFVE